MTRDEARAVLSWWKKFEYTKEWLHNSTHYVSVSAGDQKVTMDGEFTYLQLEAIACWMREPFGPDEV